MPLTLRKYLFQMPLRIAVVLGLTGLFGIACVNADQIPAGWEASNMKPIGYSGLDGHGGAFKMAIKHVGDHWYLYTGHVWDHGWSIVDVTDPANPKYVKFLPWPNDNTWTNQVDLHGDIMVTGLALAGFGMGDKNKPFDEGLVIWDISDPVNPKQLSHWKTGGGGTHRNGYPGGKYVNVSAVMPGYRGNILIFLDISDPAHPKEAGRWWMPGQKIGEEPARTDIAFHGPAMVYGNTAYLGYGGYVVILDISDIANPKMIGSLSFAPPFKGGLTGVHSVLPIPGKPVLFVNSEGAGGNTLTEAPACSGPLDLVAMVDIKDPTKPRLMSFFPQPVPPKDVPYTNFCDKGGRFGPYNTSLQYHSPDIQQQGDLLYLTYFNAGLRVYTIKDPRQPEEVGWFIPPNPSKRIGPIPGKLVNATEDVLVDARGNIFITDQQWGLFVLRNTGPNSSAPTGK